MRTQPRLSAMFARRSLGEVAFFIGRAGSQAVSLLDGTWKSRRQSQVTSPLPRSSRRLPGRWWLPIPLELLHPRCYHHRLSRKDIQKLLGMYTCRGTAHFNKSRSIERDRAADPLLLNDTIDRMPEQNMVTSLGANLEMGLYICQATGSFPYTNVKFRWREILAAKQDLDATAQPHPRPSAHLHRKSQDFSPALFGPGSPAANRETLSSFVLLSPTGRYLRHLRRWVSIRPAASPPSPKS